MTPGQRAAMHRSTPSGVVGAAGPARRYSCPYCRTPCAPPVLALSFACPCGAVAEWDVVVGEGVAVPWVAWWAARNKPNETTRDTYPR